MAAVSKVGVRGILTICHPKLIAFDFSRRGKTNVCSIFRKMGCRLKKSVNKEHVPCE